MKSLYSSLVLFLLFVVAPLTGCAQPNYGAQSENALGSTSGAADCGLKFRDSCASLVWEVQPTEEKEGTFLLEFSQAIEQNVAVVLWMPSMGHGSSPVIVEKLAPNRFRASRVFFVMPGEWEIRVQLKNGRELIEQVVLPYTL